MWTVLCCCPVCREASWEQSNQTPEMPLSHSTSEELRAGSKQESKLRWAPAIALPALLSATEKPGSTLKQRLQHSVLKREVSVPSADLSTSLLEFCFWNVVLWKSDHTLIFTSPQMACSFKDCFLTERKFSLLFVSFLLLSFESRESPAPPNIYL